MASATPAFALAGVPRVNLLPPVEIERRRRSSLVRGWTWGVFAALVVAFLLVGGAFALKLTADQALVAEQSQTNALLTELGTLSAVSGALSTEQELTAFRGDAMGSDFAWSPVIAALTGALPAEVQLVGFDVLTGGNPQTADPATEVGLTGTVTLASPTPLDLPEAVRQLRGLPGIMSVDGRAVTTGQEGVGTYSYELDITFDQSIYSGEYAPAEGAK
jgi:hypothetical protein